MLPIELEIENFHGYSNAKIDFRNFQSAVVVGKVSGNEDISNGAGKSTIFAAITYVLFNETKFSSVDLVIRHGQVGCRISFTFKSSLDNETYKIVRYRSKKSGGEVRLFRQTREDWEDLTQRTSTETEKEINKVLKINYRTFASSILFAQKDNGGIAEMKPKDRKSALKDTLQLGVYSKYEKTVKKKIEEINKDVERNQTLLSSLGSPDKDLQELNKRLKELTPQKKEAAQQLESFETALTTAQESFAKAQREVEGYAEKMRQDSKESQELFASIKSLSLEVSKIEHKVQDLKNQEIKGIERGQGLLRDLKKLKSNELRTVEIISADLKQAQANLIEKQSDLKSAQSKLCNNSRVV